MAKLEVLIAPHPILKKKAIAIEAVDDRVRTLMGDMLQTMYDDRGIGLAANQVGVLKRVMVLDLQNDDEQERPEGFYPLYIANPEVTKASDELVVADEYCMSVPDQQGVSVARHASIKIRYLDYNNKAQELEANGWLARAIQHEMDHLNGKILIDYLSPLKKNVVLRRLMKLKKMSA
jgi:peptide deformylase